MGTEFAVHRKTDGPPTDDVCPICLDEFTAPCITNCRHWFCADCILKLWYYRGRIRKCKCPKCNRDINKLMMDSSLFSQDDEQSVRVLEQVIHYNGLYAGGWHFLSIASFLATQQLQKKDKCFNGCLQKVLYYVFVVRYILLFITQPVIWRLMNPDLYLRNANCLRFTAFLLANLYLCSGFDFIPTGKLSVLRLFDNVAIALATTLYLVATIQRIMQEQR